MEIINAGYSNVETCNKIIELTEQKKIECENLKETFIDAIRHCYESPIFKNSSSEAIDADIEAFLEYYDAEVEFLNEQEKFYDTVFRLSFQGGTGKGSAWVSHTYCAWNDFYEELNYGINNYLFYGKEWETDW